MSIACVYFHGFAKSQSDLHNTRTISQWQQVIIGEMAYFKWQNAGRPIGMDWDFWLSAETEYQQHSRLIINQREDQEESLKNRWGRVQTELSWLWESKFDVHILAYSIGCHLAARFAAELQEKTKNGIKSFRLVAPDPKFRPTDLDVEERDAGKSSAYDQATEFWKPSQHLAGKCLCDDLRELSEKLPHLTINIIYSHLDEIAVWKGNTEFMMETCAGDGFAWSQAMIGETRRVGAFQVNLEPEKAYEECWIHKQMFQEARRSFR